MTTTRTYSKIRTLKLSKPMTGACFHLSADSDDLTSRYFGNEKQLAEMLEVAARDSVIVAAAVKMAAANLNADTEKEATYRSIAGQVRSCFKESLDVLTVKEAHAYFMEKTGIKTGEPKFTAAMAEAGFGKKSRNGGGNAVSYYMIGKI